MKRLNFTQILISVLLVSCTSATPTGGIDPGPVLSSVEVTPPAATIQIGDSVVYSAIGHQSDGSTAAVNVEWTTTGGSISAAGVYHTGADGTFLIIATTSGGAFADTATIVVSADPVPVTLTSVTVTPASATLDTGASAQFSALGHFSNGTSGATSINWTATGGTISADGLYQAGAAAGSYRVIATSTTANLADTSQVTLQTVTPPPPPGTVLFEEAFENASVASRGWYDNTSPAISTVEHHGGSGALEMTWNLNAQLPIQGGAIRHKFTATDRVYLRYWVKYSANFIGSGRNYHPHEFYFLTDVDGDYIGPSATHLTTYVEQNYQNGGIPEMSMTDALNIDAANINVDLSNLTEQRASAGCNGSADGYPNNCYQSGGEWRNEKIWRAAQPMFKPNPGPGYKGDWHMIEVYYQLNTIAAGKAQKDGIAQYWFDGQLVIDKPGIIFRTAAHPTMKLNQFLIAPYIGDGSPAAQSMWVDDILVGTSRP